MNTEGTVTIALSCHAKDADATTTIAANLIDTTGNSHNINVANPTLTVKKDNPGQVVIPGATIYGGVPSWYTVNYPSNGYRNNSIGLLSKDLWGFSYSAPYHFYTVTFATRESTELGKYIGTVTADHDIKPNSLYIQKTDADNQVTDITNSALTSLSNGTLKVHFDDLKQWQIYSITFAVAAPNFTDKTTVASSFSQGSANVTANITGQYTGTSQAGFVPYIDGKDITFYQNGKFNLLDQLTAGDVEDGTLTNAIKVVDEGGFDISKPGTYLVKYSVTDSDGNIVTYSRNVSVIASTKAGDVTATYVDTDGHKIADDRVLHGNIGDKYTTTQKQVNGYTFKELHGSATGAFTDTAQTVIYVYAKDHADSSSSDSSNPSSSSNNLSSEHNSSSSSNANNQDSSSASSTNSNQITASTSSNRPSDSSQSMQSSSKADQSSQKSLLPKTAAEAASWLGIAGVLISGLAGLLVFLKRHAR
ncbi:MucBP domain-containing protein [Furfurilactobacillus sp. WILCCON 0119]